VRDSKAVNKMLKPLVIDGKRYPVSFQFGCFTEHLVMRDTDGSEIAHFSWHQYSGEIWDVRVRETFRHRGIATKLLEMARGIEPAIHHSADRTPDGDGWACSLGETLPPRSKWRSK
jgi:GNAT superfamily N-acetyltransferase